MAPISSITSSLTTALQSLGGVTETSTPEPVADQGPVFLETLTTQNRAFALGLGAPRNHGDIEAIFQEIATKFGIETSKASDYAEAAKDAKRATSLGAAAGNLAFFASLDGRIQAAEENIAKQKGIIAEKTQQIKELEAQKSALEDQYDTYRSEYTDNAGTITENSAEITKLGIEVGALELAKATACGIDSGSSACKDVTADLNAKKSQLDALVAETGALIDRNKYLDREMIKLEGQTIDLWGKITGLEFDIAFAKFSIKLSEAEISLAQGLLDAFSLILLPFSVDLALRTINEQGTESFYVTPDQAGLDKAIADAADNIADQAARMGVIDALRKALDRSPTEDSTNRDTLAKALADAGSALGDRPADLRTDALLGVLASLRQVIGDSQSAGGEEPLDPVTGVGANRDDLIKMTLAEKLPAGTGDEQKVADLAEGLGSGLALLQSVLGLIAEGESALGTQVPGASGRLNLAI